MNNSTSDSETSWGGKFFLPRWMDWWRLKKWRQRQEELKMCEECGDLTDSEDDGPPAQEGKQVIVGICAMSKKSQSKPMKEILTRLEEFEYLKMIVFPEEVILEKPVDEWPVCDCLISFHSKGFPLEKAIQYANLRNPFIINNLHMQYDIQDRRKVYAILESEGIEIPRYAVLDRDSPDPKHNELIESEDHVEVNGVVFNKPFVEKPVSAEDHNIYIYYPTSAGGGSQRLFRKIGSRSSVYSPESRVRKTGSFIYEDFMPTDGTDVKVYTVGPDYAHAEARKSPALDGKVERDSEGKEIRYPVILSNDEKLISRKVCMAFKQTVCGFDLLRANGKSFVCDVNGFSFVKNSNKYYDDCAKILGNMILRELAPTLHIPWSVPFQLDDPPIVPTTFGKMMELRCVVAVIRHGDRTPKQKMKVEVRHPKFFEIFAKYDGYNNGHVKLKRPKQLQEILDIARSLLSEIEQREADPEIEEKRGKLEQLKSVLEMYGHFSGINRKVQMKYQPKGRPRGSSSDDEVPAEPSLVLILKWGGELTPAGRIQAEELGRIFRCMYPGGQARDENEDKEVKSSDGLKSSGKPLESTGTQGLGLLRLHSTFRHDLKIYASDEGRVQMTAAAFAKGLLALEGELTPILVQMVKSANTNGLLDNDCDLSKFQLKARLHELMQRDREFTPEDRREINPCGAISINTALDFVKNPVRCCQHVHELISKLLEVVKIKKEDPKTKDAVLYHGETWELMGRRWGKIEKDFCTKSKRFAISKIPDIYDCIKYDLQHNQHTLQFEHAEELYIYSKYLADIVIPQEYGMTEKEKLSIGQGICTPLLKKIRADLQRNIEEAGEESVNRLNPFYSYGVSSPGRHVRTRLYFTSESHVHSLLTVLRYGGLLDVLKDEQWRRAMEYVSMVSELNYMCQIVVMLYEDPTKDPTSEERFHVELHFSPGVNCCVQKNLPPGPGFRPHSRNESAPKSQCDPEESPSGNTIDEEELDCLTPTDDPLPELSDDNEKPDDTPLINTAISEPIPIKRQPSLREDDGGSSLIALHHQALSSVTSSSTGGSSSTIIPGVTDSSSSNSIQTKTSNGTSGGLPSSGQPLSMTSLLGSKLAEPSSGQPRSASYTATRPASPDGPEVRSRSYDQQRDDVHSSDKEGISGARSADHTPPSAVSLGRSFSLSSPSLPSPPISPISSLTSLATATNLSCSDASTRRHRHSISGQMSYLKMLGFGLGPGGHLVMPYKKMASSTSSLFSTAVISGSSSAPNLRDMIPNTASASGLMWSGPPSFVSSSGASSPNALSDFFHRGCCTSGSSDMSASLISNDGGGGVGLTAASLAQMLPPVLDQDLSSVGILLEEGGGSETEPRGCGGDSGELTPISVSASSEFDFDGIKYEDEEEEVEASASADFDITVVEQLSGGGNNEKTEEPKIIVDRSENMPRSQTASISKSPNDDKRRPRSGSYLGAKMIGQWVRDTTDSCKADEEDEGTITSSMSTTSPARKSIFQVFGSPVTRDMIAEEPATSAPTINSNQNATRVGTSVAVPGSQNFQGPMLTLATSLTDRPNIARGFDIKPQNNENKKPNENIKDK